MAAELSPSLDFANPARFSARHYRRLEYCTQSLNNCRRCKSSFSFDLQTIPIAPEDLFARQRVGIDISDCSQWLLLLLLCIVSLTIGDPDKLSEPSPTSLRTTTTTSPLPQLIARNTSYTTTSPAPTNSYFQLYAIAILRSCFFQKSTLHDACLHHYQFHRLGMFQLGRNAASMPSPNFLRLFFCFVSNCTERSPVIPSRVKLYNLYFQYSMGKCLLDTNFS